MAKYSRIFHVIFAIVVSVCFYFLCHTNGPGISHDTLLFFEAGNNLFSGEGYSVLGESGNLEFCGSVPPLYPMALAVFNGFDGGVLILQSLLFGVTAYLLFILRSSLMKDDASIATHTFSWFLITCIMLFVFPFFYTAFSESLFIPLFLVFLIMLHRKADLKYLVSILILISLTRVVGVTVGFSLAIAVIIVNRNFRNVLIYILASVLPVLIWMMISKVIGTGVTREIVWHPMKFKVMLKIPRHFGQLFLGTEDSELALITGLFLLIAVIIILIFSWRKKLLMPLLLSGFIVTYIVFLILSISAIDYATPIENRILLPVYLVLWVLIIYGLSQVALWMKYLTMILIIMMCFRMEALIGQIQKLNEEGFGYSSVYVQDFDLIDHFENNQYSQPVYSNDPTALLYLTGVSSAQMPVIRNRYTNQKTDNFNEVWFDFIEYVKKEGGTLIMIRSGTMEKTFINHDDLKRMFRDDVVYDDWVCLIIQPK